MPQRKTPKLTSLLDLIENGQTHFNSHPLFMFNRGGVDYSVNYSDFCNYVKSLSRGFMHTLPKKRRIAVIGETSVEWVGTYLASIVSGGEVVPLDASINQEQLAGFVNHAKCDAIAYSDSWAEYIEANMDQMPEVSLFIRTSSDEFSLGNAVLHRKKKIMSILEVAEIGNAKKDLELPEQNTEKMCTLLFTSGTTGSSKGVMLCQRNICSMLNDAHIILNEIDQDDVLLSVLPIHHTYELGCGILAPMTFGASIAINDSLRHVAKNMKKYRPTVMALVPLFVEQLYKNIMNSIKKQGKEATFNNGLKLSRAARRVGIDLRPQLFAQIREAFGGRIKYFVSGGAALNPKYVQLFDDIGIKISQGYGITECSPLIAVVPFKVHNPTSCGKVIPGMQVFIDKVNPTDTFGEIVVKGDNVMLGYYENQEATDEVLHKGWFYTGDYGYIDKNNYLYITGRKKNVIVLQGGKNVFPEEIEEYLAEVALIEESVVLGREAEDGKVSIVAIVYPNREHAESLGLSSDQEIEVALKQEISKINKKLVNFKHIDKLEIRKEPFEKTTTKKIKRFTVS